MGFTRRPGVGTARRPGFRGIGTAEWTPKADPSALLWWDPSTLAAGAVSSWTDRIAGVALTQGVGANQPTAGPTEIGGGWGVTNGSTKSLSGNPGAILGGKTTLTIVCSMVDQGGSGDYVAAEYTNAYDTTNGGFAINPASTNQMGAGVRGTVGYTGYYSTDAAGSLASATVISIGLNFAATGSAAIPFIRANGVTLTRTSGLTNSAAGSAANSTLYLFGRTGSLFRWVGTYGHIVIRNSVSTGADLTQVERYVGSKCGVTI